VAKRDKRVNRVAEILRFDWFDIPILTVIIWGWVRWLKRAQPRTLCSILSLVGFTLATLSGILAISSMFYSIEIGGFPYYDPRLLRIFRWGGLLSISGIVFALGGSRQSSALRWHAIGLSAGMLLFWFMSAAGE
jgi:hypothetical protein